MMAATVANIGTRLFRAHRSASTTAVPLRYLLALALVALAFAMTLVLQHYEQDRPTLFLFFAAIVAAAWFGGAGPGVFAVAMSIPAGIYFYSAALHSFTINLDNALLFLFFGSCAMAGGFLSSRQREAEEGLQRTHSQLEVKARELQSTNTALLGEISERRRTEQALREAQSELARVARLTTMGELTASIAHEINQPLAAVVTTAGSCLRWLDNESPNVGEARLAAQRIIRDGNRASDVIGRIRAMVKRALPERTPLDINGVIEDVLSFTKAELGKNRITVRTALDGGLSAIHGDRVLLQQVFLNLIVNAIESMSLVDGGPRELVVVSRRSPCGGAEIEVRDTGAGIRDEARDKLFEAFVTTKPHGMGLGLSICRSIVESHGGTLSAAAAEPRGAVFRVALPQDGEAQ
jgi:C4-dicarboxylate-specific signal transduction histidine kinase